MQALRSALFNLLMIVSAAVWAAVSLFTVVLPHDRRYAVTRLWARFVVHALAAVCGLRYEVQGAERLPSVPAVVLSKHQSAWETIAFQEIFPPQCWVLKHNLLWIPLFGWALALTWPVPIKRSEASRALRAVVAEGARRLAGGRWVVVFPEGTRVDPGARGRYNPGGALLAEKTGAPVVPVAHNAGHFWPRRGFIKRAGTIQVRIGPVIDPAGKSAKEINRLAEDWIEGQMAELEGR